MPPGDVVTTGSKALEFDRYINGQDVSSCGSPQNTCFMDLSPRLKNMWQNRQFWSINPSIILILQIDP